MDSSLDIHILITLILIATGVAITVRWIKVPYSIALVVVGLFMGIFHVLPPITVTPQLIFLVFLPALLFEAAWHLSLNDLKECIRPVVLLATVGVFVSTVLVAAVMQGFGCFDFSIALLFGAMVSATDPISVIALFKRIGAPTRLTIILEGESLFNDGTSVVLFNLLLSACASGTAFSVGGLTLEFAKVTIGGTLLGAAIGYGASRLVRYFDDPLLETTLTVLVAYGSYLLAEHFHVSPIISVLVAGMIAGSFGSRTGMTAATRLSVSSFWEYAAFLAESLLFLLIGLQINIDLLSKYSPLIGAAILAIMVGRFGAVYLLAPFCTVERKRIPWSWRHLIFWGGLRGSLCMAMALSLPSWFPFREPLIITTFGVALFTLLVQGMSMESLVVLLKLLGEDSNKRRALLREMERVNKQLQQLKEQSQQLKIMKKEYLSQKELLDNRKAELEATLIALPQANGSREIDQARTERALLQSQKDCIVSLAREGTVSQEILDDYLIKIDTQLDTLSRPSKPAEQKK